MQSAKNKNLKGRLRAFGTAICAAVLSASLAFSACAVGFQSGEKGKTPSDAPVAAAEATDTNSLRYIVNGDFEAAWNSAVATSKTKSKQVWFILDADWEAPVGGNNPFGADSDGFSHGRITVPAGADIVLDLNGHNINRRLTTYTQLGSVLCVDGGKLTIEDGAGGGTITGGFTGEYRNWHPDELDYDYGGGIIMKSGELTLNGGSVTGNRADCAGGICVAGGKFIMNGGSVTNNIADRASGGIEFDRGSGHEINGGEISYNQVTGVTASGTSVHGEGGGGIYIYGECPEVTMNGGSIHHNKIVNSDCGGGVFVSPGVLFRMNGGEICYNESSECDAAIGLMWNGTTSLANTGAVELNGGLITGNISKSTSLTGAITCTLNNSIKIGGPVRIYGNFGRNGEARDLCVGAYNRAAVTIVSGTSLMGGQSAWIGLCKASAYSGKTQYPAVNNFTDTDDDAGINISNFFFTNEENIVTTLTSGTTVSLYNAAAYGATIPQESLNWEIGLDDGTTITESTKAGIELEYGKIVTSVKSTYTNSSGNTSISLWSADNPSNTENAMLAIKYSDTNRVLGTFANEVKNAGFYTFFADGTASAFVDDNDGWGSVFNNLTMCINIKPKEIKVNLIDKGHQYGDAVADLYAEEDVLDNAGQPTGDKIKAEVDPATPLVGNDATYALNSFVTLSTEAVASSEIGCYNVKGAVKSSAPFNTNNYKFSFKTASYSVGVATITVKLKGSNTYNGSAQNPAWANLEIVYPNGTSFAGTKLSSSDVTITCGKDLINAGKYGKDDVSISLGTSANAKRFKLAETDPVSGEYEIKKAKLTCTADNKTVGVGDAPPTYTATFTGFVGSDTEATVITKQPTFACDYTTSSAKGDYTITPAGAEADNYEITYKTGKLTVGTGSIAKPTITTAEYGYDGTEHTFSITGYNATAITGVTLSDSTKFVWDAATATVKATKAGKCKITFTLDTSKYTWSDSTMTPVELEIEVKPMPLVFSLTSTGGNNWKWDYGATGTIDYALTTTTVAGDNLTYYYHYYPAADSSKSEKVAGTSIDVSKLASGSYMAEVRLVASTEAGYSADNANYTIDANSKNTQAFVIDAGGAETSDIVWQFSLNGDPATNLFKADGTQEELKYGLKADGAPNEIEVLFPDLSAVTYLQRDDNREGFTNGMKIVGVKDGVETEITGKITKPGTYKIIVALISDDNHLFDNGTKKGEASAEFTVERAEVDLSGMKLEYGWYDDDKGEVVYNDYDPKKPPVYKESWVYIRVKGGTNYPKGITNAEIVNESTDYFGDRDVPGTVSAKVKFTLDENYVYKKDGTTYENWFNETVSITLSKKKIPVSWTLSTLKDSAGKDVLDDNGLPYQIYVLDFGADPDKLAQYIKYEYYYADMSDPANPVVGAAVPSTSPSGTTTNAQLDYLIDVDGAGKTDGSSTKSVGIFIRPVIDTTVSGSENFVLDIPAGGADQFTKLGQKKNAVTVTQVKDKLVYGTEVTNLDELYTLKKGTAAYSTNSYTAVIYKGNDSAGAVAVKDFDFSTANVGTYTIKFELKASVANSDALSKTGITLEITRQEIEVPSLTGKITFNGETLNFADFLDEKYKEYLEKGIIGAVSGRATARDVGNYAAVIEIINDNYMWKQPAGEDADTAKALLKASVADEEVSSDVTIDGAAKQAEYSWKIAPFKLGTDVIDVSGKDGAKININKLPEWVRTMLTEGSLTAGVAYYADQAGTTPLTDEEIVLKGGREYFVGAVLGGDESKNFTFASDDTVNSASAAIKYKVPQSGAAAAWNNVTAFMTKTWLGLPIWAWFAIGLAVLILLIIIIAVACKRRKSKEQRAEEKARKEEERARREEERRLQQERLEQERRLQQEKIEAERELARAKQEAELEKIRAQAQMAAGAGAASVAMPQQQAQPVQQQQPVPQAMPQQQPQYQQMPAPMPMQMPMMPQQQAQGSGMDSSVMLALLQSQAAMQAQITEMRATQDASVKAEMEMLKMQMLSGNAPAAFLNVPQANGRPVQQGISAELLGEAIVSAFTRLAANGAKPAELPAHTEQETATANSHAVYPPDAVVTTTTTVDTTQKQLRRTERDGTRNDFVDVDGFYDSID